MKFYLRGQHLYGEYIGNIVYGADGKIVYTSPQIDSPDIDFNLTRNDLIGTEYAEISVKDWINGNEKEEKKYRVKLIGPKTSCYNYLGEEGVSGSKVVPRLLLNWKWDEISENQCENTNTNYTYCDGVQFNVSLFKKLKKINELYLGGKKSQVPKLTSFYAYLIKDNYNKNLLTDFVEHYSSQPFTSDPFFRSTATQSGFDQFIKQDKLNYMVRDGTQLNTILPYGGLYRVEIEINEENENIPSIFMNNEPNSTINVTFVPIQKASNYNLLYETPFDGEVGKKNSYLKREEYGSSITGVELKINQENRLFDYGNSLVKLSGQEIKESMELNKGIVFIIDNQSKRIILSPSQPTPVAMSIVSQNGQATMQYSLSDIDGFDTVQKEWLMTSSSIGREKCLDFEGNDKRRFIETATLGGIKQLSWNGTTSGKLTLGTIFFTPKMLANTPKATPIGNTILSSYDYLMNAKTVMLNNYDYQGITDYDNLEKLLELISEEKMCMSQNNGEKFRIWWNEKYLDQLMQQINPSNNC